MVSIRRNEPTFHTVKFPMELFNLQQALILRSNFMGTLEENVQLGSPSSAFHHRKWLIKKKLSNESENQLTCEAKPANNGASDLPATNMW